MRHALPLAAAAAIGAVLLWRHIRRSPSLSEEERRVVAALKAVQRRIGSRGVNLIAVSKKKPANLIAAAHGAGQADFGENYVQEIVAKAPLLPDSVRWHFIGHLQTNKVKELLRVPNLVCIHTVDTVKLAMEIEKRVAAQAKAGLREIPLDVMVQVNTSGEEAKSGCTSEACPQLCKQVQQNCPSIRLVGLMCIGKYSAAEGDAVVDFRRLASCRRDVAAALGVREDSIALSMGMSHDFEAAIDEGATHVRVGSTIFGARV